MGRRHERTGSPSTRGRVRRALLLPLVAIAVATTLGACGDASAPVEATSATATPAAQTSPPPSPSSSALASPEEARAREVVTGFLAMVEAGDFDDLSSLATSRYVELHEGAADAPLDELRLLDLRLSPLDDGTTVAELLVYLDPGPQPSPWGTEAGERTLFASLVPTSDGGWLVDDFGTGP